MFSPPLMAGSRLPLFGKTITMNYNRNTMRRYHLILPMLAALAMASGCKTMEEEVPGKETSEKMYPVHFFSNEIETKTVLGPAETSAAGTSYSTRWSANDSQIAVSLNLKEARPATVTPSTDYKTATFDAQFPQSDVQAPYTFYALSPYSAAVSAASNLGGYHFRIPAEQTPLAASPDEGAQVLVASREATSIDDFSNVELQFSHVTAYGKFTLNSMSLPDGAAIRSVELTASVPLAGDYGYRYADASLSEMAVSRTISLKTDNVVVDNGSTTDIWFACAPADLGDGTLKVDVVTSKGVLSRTITIAAGKLAFNAGRVSKFSVNMSTAVFTPIQDRWVLVTDASAPLEAGNEIIIASSATVGAAYALSTSQDTDSRGKVAVDIVKDSDNQIVIDAPGTSVEVLKLVAGAYAGHFYLQEATSVAGHYLYTGSGTENKLLSASPTTVVTAYSSFANWAITLSGEAACICTYGQVASTSNYRQLRYNNSGFFNSYQSSSNTSWSGSAAGTSTVYVFRKEAGLSLDADPVLQQEIYGAYLTDGNLTYRKSLCQLSREYQPDSKVTFTILTPASHLVAEFTGIPANPAKGDTFTLNYALGDGTHRSEQDYPVTVVKVDGPKVWLTDGSGNGFIVKK